MAQPPRVVVGIDGSEDCRKALLWAVEHAKTIGGEIDAVAAPEMHLTAMIKPSALTEGDYVADAEDRLEHTLKETLEGDPGVQINRVVSRGRAAQALVETARDAALLVIGSRGQGELPFMHLGSTANYCVHHAPCPVVVVRSQIL